MRSAAIASRRLCPGVCCFWLPRIKLQWIPATGYLRKNRVLCRGLPQAGRTASSEQRDRCRGEASKAWAEQASSEGQVKRKRKGRQRRGDRREVISSFELPVPPATCVPKSGLPLCVSSAALFDSGLPPAGCSSSSTASAPFDTAAPSEAAPPLPGGSPPAVCPGSLFHGVGAGSALQRGPVGANGAKCGLPSSHIRADCTQEGAFADPVLPCRPRRVLCLCLVRALLQSQEIVCGIAFSVFWDAASPLCPSSGIAFGLYTSIKQSRALLSGVAYAPAFSSATLPGDSEERFRNLPEARAQRVRAVSLLVASRLPTGRPC